MKKISILCPTRQRAERAYKYMNSVFNTAAHPDRIEILFYVDNDDPELEKYKGYFGYPNVSHFFPGDEEPYNVKLIVGEPISVSKSWNILAERCTGDILLMGNDDLLHETIGWDDVLEETSNEYKDDIYCIFFNDGINAGRHCAFPSISRKWYETLGYFSPTIGFEFLYNDTWIFDIARKVNRVRYVPEVMVRHNHWTVLKEKDPTTKRHRDDNPGRARRDKTLFERTNGKREESANKIRNVML